MISIVEFPMAFLVEEKGFSRKKSALFIVSSMAIIGVLTVHPESLLGNVQILSVNLSDFFGMLSDNLLMPLGGLLTALFVGYVIKKEDLET